ncbi:MAG: hypothetical protein H6Q14_1083 [Bacteroidetes bacterium]|nr:hypothetical protein [Bacteroidota bacterium]
MRMIYCGIDKLLAVSLFSNGCRLIAKSHFLYGNLFCDYENQKYNPS